MHVLICVSMIHFQRNLNCIPYYYIIRGSRIFERGGSIIGLQAKKGGSRRGSNFGPNVKKPTSWAKKEGSGLPGPPPPDPSMTMDLLCRTRIDFSLVYRDYE